MSKLATLFAGLLKADADEAIACLRRVDVGQGKPITIQGEVDRTLAFVSEGSVDYWRDDTKVGLAGPGDMIGECELFADTPRLTSASATTDVVLQALETDAYATLCERGNPIIHAIERAALRRISDRICLLVSTLSEHASGVEYPLFPEPEPGLLTRLGQAISGPTPQPELDVVELLASTNAFGWNEPDVLEAIASYFTVEACEPDVFLSKQGVVADKAFILARGRVDVVLLISKKKAEVLATLEPGMSFGDVSVALGGPRPVTCVSRGPGEVLVVERDDYLSLHKMNDYLGSAFRQSMIRNLVASLQRFMDRYVALNQSYEERRRIIEAGQS